MKWHLLHRKLVLLIVLVFGCRLLALSQQQHFMYIQSDSKEAFTVVMEKKRYNSSNTGYLIIAKVASGPHNLAVVFPQKKYPSQVFDIVLDSVDAGFGLKNLGAKGWGLINLQTMKMVMASHVIKPADSTAAATKQVKPAPATTAPATTAPAKTAATAAPAKTGTTKPAAGTKTAPAKPAADNSMFGDMLSQVVDDPTLKEAPKPAPQPAQQQPATLTAAAQTPKTQPVTTPPAPEEKSKPAETVTDTAAADDAATRGVIKATQESKNEGTQVTFLDFNSKKTDTVKIFIPKTDAPAETPDTVAAAPQQQPVVTAAVPPAQTQPQTQKPGKRKKKELTSEPLFNDAPADSAKTVSNPFYTKPKDAITPVAAATETAASPQPKTEAPAATATGVNNSNCKALANDNDVTKLRKRMAGAGDEDKMIEAARKAFKSKCYSTEQIKSLGMLFYTDETRYRFYDAGYPFVYDVSNYISLENMLIDDYYKKRFRAMLRL
ncbi:DUF4476 domain-containing protein [Deminuibacter soli]|uniref:DUF4476 domain-containing protein n=1 Tax=Deminuibacter soli TaxID=2291815 RepID=A0A3E1NCM5_9BACT|nr:DUF4476 domain-containing protein [Deminuibacter soli]RFM25736.1 DUF4476 domain-containing protein [Deminuibacter soli]